MRRIKDRDDQRSFRQKMADQIRWLKLKRSAA
jgi:hypothetical protein